MGSVMITRMHKELRMLAQAPPPGVSAWCVDGKVNELEAVIQGPEDTPYEEGYFKLEINIPERYPNDPPKVRFITPVYHPNIDNGGRICLDTLKMPPKGAWTPSLNIPTLLTTLRLLLSMPNPDDPLMPDITEEFVHNHNLFVNKARNWTRKHANNQPTEQSASISSTPPPKNNNNNIPKNETPTKNNPPLTPSINSSTNNSKNTNNTKITNTQITSNIQDTKNTDNINNSKHDVNNENNPEDVNNVNNNNMKNAKNNTTQKHEPPNQEDVNMSQKESESEEEEEEEIDEEEIEYLMKRSAESKITFEILDESSSGEESEEEEKEKEQERSSSIILTDSDDDLFAISDNKNKLNKNKSNKNKPEKFKTNQKVISDSDSEEEHPKLNVKKLKK